MPVRVQVEFARRVSVQGAAGYEEAISSMSFQIATALARSIKTRVAEQGNPAQGFPGYDDTRSGRIISPRYPAGRGGQVLRSDGVRYPSTETFQDSAGTKDGSYSVSGGMWDGLTVVSSGTRVASVQFRGRSEAQRPKFRELRSGTKARPYKISNSAKAATILQRHGVNVLALTDAELEEASRAIERYIRDGLDASLLAVVDWPRAIQSVRLLEAR